MGVSISWAPIDGALMTTGIRNTAIDTAWRLIPLSERSATRRKLIIALVDHVREHYERTGQLAPSPEGSDE